MCTGNFEVAGAHMSYGSTSAASAKKKLLDMARGGGDNNCCHPPPLPALPSPEQWEQTINANGGKIPKARPGTTVDQWAQAVSVSAGKVPEYAG